MADVDELARGLAAGAEVLDESGFSIDHEQARAKLRQFQLPDPRRYVLLLVQAAVHLGASRIDFEIDADDVRVRFDGDPLLASDLERLYRCLFVHETDARSRGRRELAVAVNAAMALHPRFVRVCSFVGERGAFLELRPDEADAFGTLERGRDEPGHAPLTTVHVRDRFRPGLLLEFFRNLRGDIAEERILREHCRFASIPVLVDGRAISSTLVLRSACLVRVPIDSVGIRGEAGFVDDGELEARADLLGAGVLVRPQVLKGFPSGFRAVIDAPRVRTDLSHSDLVRDEAYAEVLDVLEAAADRALAELAAHVADDERAVAPWVLAMFRAALARRGPIDRIDLDGATAAARLAAVRLWPTSEGLRSTAELHEAGRDVELVTGGLERGVPPGWEHAVLASDVDLRRQLRAVFGPRAIDRSSALDTAIERLSRRDAFLGRAFPNTLRAGDWRARWWIRTDAFTGEVGLRRAARDEPAIRLVLGGRLLESRRLELRVLPVHGLVAVVEGPFRPHPNWDRAERDEVLADGLLEIVRSVHGLARQEALAVAEAPIDVELVQLLAPYLAAVARGSFEPVFFAAMGYGHAWARAHLQARGHAPPAIDPGSVFGALRLFETVDGRAVSLRDIDRERGDGPVFVVSDAHARLHDPPPLVLRLDADGLEIVHAIFAVERLEEPRERPELGRDPPAGAIGPVEHVRGTLLDAVRDQLRAVLSRAGDRIDDALLDVLELRAHGSPALAFTDGPRIVLNTNHVVTRRASIDHDPILVALAASAVLTALRDRVREVDDDTELELHRLHAELLLAAGD
jgi:hypothetical protein